jgi:monofunctional biosynthetic peptidoglycan transglycosylase
MMNSRASSRRGAAPRTQPRLVSGRAARPKSGLLRRVGRIALYSAIGFIIGSIALVALYRVLPPPGTPLMLIRLVEGYRIDKSWRSLDEISPHLIRAAMAGEDARFCRHHGFDWGAVATAWDRYQSGHGRLFGASTISMQTAKNVFLWPGRDWLRKGFEAWFTALIELAWGKRRIMEIYLNVAEWGPGVYGAEAAARHYFHKPADALNPEEAVRLAAALPDPLGWPFVERYMSGDVHVCVRHIEGYSGTTKARQNDFIFSALNPEHSAYEAMTALNMETPDIGASRDQSFMLPQYVELMEGPDGMIPSLAALPVECGGRFRMARR